MADAMRRDSMVTVVVNCDDGVPRFSRVNILKMAMELRTTDAPFDKWKNEDQATVKTYIETYGKARDFVDEDLSLEAEAKAVIREEGSDSEDEVVSAKEVARAQKAKEKDDELASKRAEEIAMLRKRLDESTYLVLPGNIVHMYRDNGMCALRSLLLLYLFFYFALYEGILATSHVDHRFSTFRDIKLFQGLGEDHAMHNYRLSIADAIRWRGLDERPYEGKSDGVRRPPEWQVLCYWIVSAAFGRSLLYCLTGYV